MGAREFLAAGNSDDEPRIERRNLPDGGYVETGEQISSDNGSQTTTIEHRDANGGKVYEEHGIYNPTSGESFNVVHDFYPGGEHARRSETTFRYRWLEGSEVIVRESDGRVVSRIGQGLSLITGRLKLTTEVFDRNNSPLIDETRIIQAAPPRPELDPGIDRSQLLPGDKVPPEW